MGDPPPREEQIVRVLHEQADQLHLLPETQTAAIPAGACRRIWDASCPNC